VDHFPLRFAFSVEEALNFIAVEAAIWTGAPVRGLRPVRAGRFEVLNEPKPGHATLSPFLAFATTVSKKAPIVRSASAFETLAALHARSFSCDRRDAGLRPGHHSETRPRQTRTLRP